MLTSWIVLVLECKGNKNYRWKLCDYEIKESRLRYEEKFNEMKKKCQMFIKPDLLLTFALPKQNCTGRQTAPATNVKKLALAYD